MDLMLLMKAGFAGFALTVGVIMLTFYVAGWILKSVERTTGECCSWDALHPFW